MESKLNGESLIFTLILSETMKLQNYAHNKYSRNN